MLLAILDTLGMVYGRTYLQKLLFIIRKELQIGFDYEEYHYGPFSRELNNCINALVKGGLIEESVMQTKANDCYVYRLTDSGKEAARKTPNKNSDNFKKKEILEICERFRGFKPTDLLRYVYQKYPDWATKSKFTG